MLSLGSAGRTPDQAIIDGAAGNGHLASDGDLPGIDKAAALEY